MKFLVATRSRVGSAWLLPLGLVSALGVCTSTADQKAAPAVTQEGPEAPALVVVPNVLDDPVDLARAKISQLGLLVRIRDAGSVKSKCPRDAACVGQSRFVYRQHPLPGAKVSPRFIITLETYHVEARREIMTVTTRESRNLDSWV